MKKKGFTLIELLAVIIILAIVALIATPKVLDIIEDTRRSAFEQSARGYYKATEYIYNEMFLDGTTEDVNFTFKDGAQTSSNSNYKLEVSGEKPKGGLIYLFKDGRIMLSIHNNKYCANVDYEGKVSISEDINDCTSGITVIPKECYSISQETINDIKYNMLDYDRTNTNCPLNIDTLIIPNEVDGQVVEGIGSYAFHHERGKDSTNAQEVSVKNVIISEGIKMLGEYAFYKSGLVNVELPDSITSIGKHAFYSNQLTSVIIPINVETLGTYSFQSNKITDVTLLATNILTNYISASKSRPFRGNNIEKLTIGDNVTRIPNYMFANFNLTNVTVPDSVTSIGEGAFNGNPIKEFTIGNGISSISGDFALNTNIEKLTIGQNAGGNITIGDSAFSNASIKELTLGPSVTSIGIGSFANNQLTSIEIPSSVSTIGFSAFSNNQLTSVTIPNSVTSIGNSAFYDNQLTSVEIPEGVISIGSAAFANNQLTDVIIPSSVTTIGQCAFANNQLTSVTIPSTVTSIGSGAFNNNQLPDSQAFIYARNDKGVEDTTTVVSYGGAKRENIIIPSGVTTIGQRAFANNQLTSVTIPSTVTSIGGIAFDTNQLTSITIPSSVTYIDYDAFSHNNFSDSNAIKIEGDSTRFDSKWRDLGFPAK